MSLHITDHLVALLSSPSMTHAFQTFMASTLLILLVLVLRKPVARHFGAGVAYTLWLLPVARLALPPLSSGSFLSWAQFPVFAQRSTISSASTHTHSDHVSSAPFPPEAAAIMPPVPALPPVPDTGFETDAANISMPPLSEMLMLMAGALLLVWAAGAVFFAARSVLRHAGFMRILDRESRPISEDLQSLSIEIARQAGLKRMPRIVTSLISSGPFVTGLLRPTVVLPAWFEEDYTRSEARAAIAHELTHVKRGDLWALQVCELFVALMWFNPLAYLARRAFRTDQEAACDADVLRRGHTSAHAYGATLVKAVRMQMPSRMALTTSLPLTHALKERLKLMSYPAPDTRRRWMGISAAALLGTAALAATASVAVAGEPRSHNVRIENGTLWIDGQKVENRQAILLSDPVAGLLPDDDLPKELERLTLSLTEDVAALTAPALALAGTGETQHWDEVTRLSLELANSATQDALTMAGLALEGRSGEEIEAWSERLTARTEDMAKRIEESANRLAARAANIDTAAIDAHSAALQKVLSERETKISAAIERHYGEDFKARLDARANVIPELAARCAGMRLAENDTRILEQVTDTGTRFKLACISGGPGAAQSEMAAAYINSHPGLTDAERQAFEAHRTDGKHVFTYSRRSDTETGTETGTDN